MAPNLKMLSHVLLCFYFVLQGVFSCPDTCMCSFHSSTCWINSCEDILPVDDTLHIIIHGELCENQRQLLAWYGEIFITLLNSKCEELQNCESWINEVTTDMVGIITI